MRRIADLPRSYCARACANKLSYVARNLGYLSEVKARLSEQDQKQFQVIEILYAQQKQMYEQGSKRVDDRIVSLHQPWVRPIVRGKAKAAVEFWRKDSSISGGWLSPY
jgi:IS5 family transposase